MDDETNIIMINKAQESTEQSSYELHQTLAAFFHFGTRKKYCLLFQNTYLYE